MNRRTIGVSIATLLVVLAALFGCSETLLANFDQSRVVESPSSRRPADEPTPAEPIPAGPDELCALHQHMSETMDSVAGRTDPASEDLRYQALLDFHAAAASVVDEPDATAFRAMHDYWNELHQWSEANGGSFDLEALAERPVIPADASRRTAELLEVRCGVVPQRDTGG